MTRYRRNKDVETFLKVTILFSAAWSFSILMGAIPNSDLSGFSSLEVNMFLFVFCMVVYLIRQTDVLDDVRYRSRRKVRRLQIKDLESQSSEVGQEIKQTEGERDDLKREIHKCDVEELAKAMEESTNEEDKE